MWYLNHKALLKGDLFKIGFGVFEIFNLKWESNPKFLVFFASVEIIAIFGFKSHDRLKYWLRGRHRAKMEEGRSAFKIFTGKPREKGLLGRPKHK